MQIYLENSAKLRIMPALQDSKNANKPSVNTINTNYLSSNRYTINQDISFGNKITEALGKTTAQKIGVVSRKIKYLNRVKKIHVPEITSNEKFREIFCEESGYNTYSTPFTNAERNNQQFKIDKLVIPEQEITITVNDSSCYEKNPVIIDEISAKKCNLGGNKLKVTKSIQGTDLVRLSNEFVSRDLEKISSPKGDVFINSTSNGLPSAKVIEAGKSVNAEVIAETINAGNSIELKGKSVVDNLKSKIAYLKDSATVKKSVDSEFLIVEDNATIGEPNNTDDVINTGKVLIKGDNAKINGNIVIKEGENPQVIIDNNNPDEIIKGLIKFEDIGTVFVKDCADTSKIRVEKGRIRRISDESMAKNVRSFEEKVGKDGIIVDLINRHVKEEEQKTDTILERIHKKVSKAANKNN